MHVEKKIDAGERQRERVGSSAAPLLGGLFHLLASGGRQRVDLGLALGEPFCLPPACLSKHIRRISASVAPYRLR